MKEGESIQKIHTKFTYITNELHCLNEVIKKDKLVRKILNVMLVSQESKVNIITEAKDLQTLTMDEMIGNLKIYNFKRQHDQHR